MTKYYTATKSRSQGREGWAVIFRHPVRVDASGKPGRRVRRGLGTANESVANQLVGELNEILQSPELWEPAARVGLVARFDERVLDIFYDGIEPSAHDPEHLRDEVLPMPGVEDGYHSVLMLGTTGAGKTTLVRQLIGTDPDTERFPSTSTAKTTVADTELIFSPGPVFRAVVTFVGRDEVIDYLTECVSEAALAILRKASEQDQRRRLLDHPNQRFRFSYILGRGKFTMTDDDDDDFDDDEAETSSIELIDLSATEEVIVNSLEILRTLVAEYEEQIRELATEDSDERLLEELREELLDSELRGDDRFHAVVDALFDEIEKRFDLLVSGEVTKNRQGWPISWSWETEDRTDLVKAVTRFSSNYAPLFGSLLTPLVNGIRVAGPFRPEWGRGAKTPKLVIIDGEGLGHTPTSAAALSTGVSKRIEVVDVVLLVDNAAQPMQAAPVAAMKAVVTSGNASKLLVVFTHFDMVKGDNLPSVTDRQNHVKASVDNVLKSVGEDIGPFAERILRQRIDRACFFVGGIDEQLDINKKRDKRTVDQLQTLLDVIDHITDEVVSTETRPVYDRLNLVLAVREAAAAFQQRWSGLLGINYVQGISKEPWQRIKALSRRFAEGFADEYDTLKPVSELKRELDEQIYRMLQQPVRWEGPAPTDEDKQLIFDALAKAISKETTVLTSRRVNADRKKAWQEAYAEYGAKSTFRRARIISNEVYDRAAPVPTVTPSPDQNNFLREVTALVDAVAASLNVKLL